MVVTRSKTGSLPTKALADPEQVVKAALERYGGHLRTSITLRMSCSSSSDDCPLTDRLRCIANSTAFG